MRLAHRFARFCIVGLIATGIHYAILFLLARGFGLNEELASTCGFIVSTGINYLLNRSYTFASSSSHLSSVPRFVVMVLIGIGINAGILALGYRVGQLPLLLAQILATGVVLVWNFTAMRYWVFPFLSAMSDDPSEGGQA